MPPENLASDDEAKEKAERQRIKIFTTMRNNLPADLSYDNVKLSNFLELELTDLQKSLMQETNLFGINALKDALSKAYNIFHEMQKMYSDMNVDYLYDQTKKLVSCFAVLFVQLVEIAQKNTAQKDQNVQTLNKTKIQEQKRKFQEQSKFSLIRNPSGQTFLTCEQKKHYKRTKGVHLYNESYARFIDYDIEQIKKLRQKIQKLQNMNEENYEVKKFEEEKQFKKQIVEEINDNSYLKLFEEQIGIFLNRQKYLEQIKSLSLSDQLQKIVRFFRDSESEALQFILKQKNSESFLQLTQGYNEIMGQYQNMKQNKFVLLHEKLQQIFDNIKKQKIILMKTLMEKQKQIQRLKELLNKKNAFPKQKQIQTQHNFDEEIRQLNRQLKQNQEITQEIQNKFFKMSEEKQKQKDFLALQINQKQAKYQMIKDQIQEKNNIIAKLEKKLKFQITKSNNGNIKDPIELFKSFDPQMKSVFIEELKQHGLVLTQTAAKRASRNVSKIIVNREEMPHNNKDQKQNRKASENSCCSVDDDDNQSDYPRIEIKINDKPIGSHYETNEMTEERLSTKRISEIYNLSADLENDRQLVSKSQIKSKKIISVRNILNESQKSKNKQRDDGRLLSVGTFDRNIVRKHSLQNLSPQKQSNGQNTCLSNSYSIKVIQNEQNNFQSSLQNSEIDQNYQNKRQISQNSNTNSQNITSIGNINKNEFERKQKFNEYLIQDSQSMRNNENGQYKYQYSQNQENIRNINQNQRVSEANQVQNYENDQFGSRYLNLQQKGKKMRKPSKQNHVRFSDNTQDNYNSSNAFRNEQNQLKSNDYHLQRKQYYQGNREIRQQSQGESTNQIVNGSINYANMFEKKNDFDTSDGLNSKGHNSLSGGFSGQQTPISLSKNISKHYVADYISHLISNNKITQSFNIQISNSKIYEILIDLRNKNKKSEKNSIFFQNQMKELGLRSSSSARRSLYRNFSQPQILTQFQNKQQSEINNQLQKLNYSSSYQNSERAGNSFSQNLQKTSKNPKKLMKDLQNYNKNNLFYKNKQSYKGNNEFLNKNGEFFDKNTKINDFYQKNNDFSHKNKEFYNKLNDFSNRNSPFDWTSDVRNNEFTEKNGQFSNKTSQNSSFHMISSRREQENISKTLRNSMPINIEERNQWQLLNGNILDSNFSNLIKNKQKNNHKNNEKGETLGLKKNKLSKQRKQLIKKLAQKFQDKQLGKAALQLKTVQEFQKKVVKVHEKKCGNQCKHLKRFIEIFKKIRFEVSPNKIVMKLHIQNLHEKLDEALTLPNIKK